MPDFKKMFGVKPKTSANKPKLKPKYKSSAKKSAKKR